MSQFPKYIAEQLSGPPPIEGQRHHEILRLSLQMKGERIPDNEIFQAIRTWIPDRDKSDKEIMDAIRGAENKNPTPAGDGLPRSTFTRTQPAEVRPHVHDGSRAPLPDDLAETNPIEFLKGLFDLDDIVCLAWEGPDGKPSRVDARHLHEWEAIYDAMPENFSTPNGVWFCINPLVKTGEGEGIRTNENVDEFKRTLLESDPPKDATESDKQRIKEEATSWLLSSGLPVARIYDSAGKSIHGLVQIDAKNAQEFKERVEQVYAYSAGYPGLDPGRKASAQLSRLPGAYRNGVKQTLRYLSVGPKSFEEWEATLPKGEQDEPEVTQELLERKYADSDREKFPEPMSAEAFYGPLGKLVKAVARYTEASEESLLCHLLVAFGSMVGRTRYLYSGDKHFCNEFLAILGDTALGRKGTAWRFLSELLKRLDAEWFKTRQLKGIQSGEGIIHAIRDPKERQARTKKEQNEYGDRPVIEDEGVKDKRLLIIEEELSQILTVAKREANTVTEILRHGWDGAEFLQNAAKNAGQIASNPHVSLIGHSTREEFREKTKNTTAAANGTINRFLICASRKAHTLADTEYIDWDRPEWRELLDPIIEALNIVSRAGVYEHRVKRDAGAKVRWETFYKAKSREEEASPGGLIGNILARSVAHVSRISLLFAVADGSAVISEWHQIAAEAVVEYCERSARWAFGILTGKPMVDKLIRELRRHPEGMTRTQISNEVFGRSWSSASISDILAEAKRSGYADWKLKPTENKPAEVWTAK